MIPNIISKGYNLLSSLFQYKNEKGGKLLINLLYFVLFCFGLLFWIKFLNYGEIPNNRLDWLQVTYPRLQTLQQSISEFQLPLHIADPFGVKDVTDRFLVIPDLILSPDIVLLKFLSISDFILLHMLICYGLGFLGLIQLKKRFLLSFTAFIPLFMLFNFNGFIISHLAVGHLTWGAYFLLPFYFNLIWDLFNSDSIEWNWIFKFTILQFCIYLIGGYHFFVWIIFFTLILFFLCKTKRKLIITAIILSFSINAYRILPSGLLSNKLSLNFHTSFVSSGQLIESLIRPSIPQNVVVSSSVIDVTIWEINFYIGLISFLTIMLLNFSFFRMSKNNQYTVLLIPIMTFTLISIGHFYRPFLDSGLPLFSGERVFTRFLILPLLILILISIIQYQQFISNKAGNPLWMFFYWFVNFFIANDLTQNAANWGLDQIIMIIPTESILLNYIIQNRIDPIYHFSLITGLFITLITIIFMCFKIKNLIRTQLH